MVPAKQHNMTITPNPDLSNGITNWTSGQSRQNQRIQRVLLHTQGLLDVKRYDNPKMEWIETQVLIRKIALQPLLLVQSEIVQIQRDRKLPGHVKDKRFLRPNNGRKVSCLPYYYGDSTNRMNEWMNEFGDWLMLEWKKIPGEHWTMAFTSIWIQFFLIFCSVRWVRHCFGTGKRNNERINQSINK